MLRLVHQTISALWNQWNRTLVNFLEAIGQINRHDGCCECSRCSTVVARGQCMVPAGKSESEQRLSVLACVLCPSPCEIPPRRSQVCMLTRSPALVEERGWIGTLAVRFRRSHQLKDSAVERRRHKIKGWNPCQLYIGNVGQAEHRVCTAA